MSRNEARKAGHALAEWVREQWFWRMAARMRKPTNAHGEWVPSGEVLYHNPPAPLRGERDD